MKIDQLKQITDNIKYLESRKKELADEIAAIYSAAKSDGFNTKVIKKLLAIKDVEDYKQEFAELQCYAEIIQPDLF
jgi:uncharacterized protein (UPF0335 family)